MATQTRKASTPCRYRTRAEEIEADLKAIENGYKRASKSRKAAIAFLARAGILDKKGNLTPPYR
jgi:hypothetical protein